MLFLSAAALRCSPVPGLARLLVLLPVMFFAPLFSQASSGISFELVTHYSVAGNAEIVSAFGDGQFLVHTNSKRDSVDVIDIRKPEAPALVASLAMPGEPTSVGVSPDGRWAMVVVYTAKSKAKRKPKDPRLPGVLALLDLRNPLQPEVVTLFGIGHHPDSIAVTERDGYLYGVVAIENEPLIVVDGAVVASDLPGQEGDISEAGAIQVVRLDPLAPAHYAVTTVALPAALLKENALLFPDDAQPEYVAVPKNIAASKNDAGQSPPLAAVSLQENNGMVLVDPFSGAIQRLFSVGVVRDRPADLVADGNAQLTQRYPSDALVDEALAGARCPDAISFTPQGDYILSADEGDLALTGGRGFSVWSLAGEFVWDDGGEIERRAVAMGLYPDARSAVRGIEVEGITAAHFDGADLAFALSERGSFVAIYNIDDPASPSFVQILETETGPESAVAIPSRGLLVVAAEKGNALSIFRASAVDSQPLRAQ